MLVRTLMPEDRISQGLRALLTPLERSKVRIRPVPDSLYLVEHSKGSPPRLSDGRPSLFFALVDERGRGGQRQDRVVPWSNLRRVKNGGSKSLKFLTQRHEFLLEAGRRWRPLASAAAA